MKKNLPILCLLAVCHVTLFAQTGQRSQIVHSIEISANHMTPQIVPAGLTRIYSNLGTKTDFYNDVEGWLLAGPNVPNIATSFIGMPFTPQANSHVSRVGVAVQYFGSGANQVNLSIYGDSNGAPGILLAGPETVKNLPNWGTCCILAVANFTPVAVTGGIQYWVVADTPLTGTGSDFVGSWATVVKPVIPIAFSGGSGWGGSNANYLVAGEVLGTVP